MASKAVEFKDRCRVCLKPSAAVRRDPKALCARCQGKPARIKRKLDAVQAGRAGYVASVDSQGRKTMVLRVAPV